VVIDIDGEKITTFEPNAGAVTEAPSIAASEITSTPLAPIVPLPVDWPEGARVPLPTPLDWPVEGPSEPLAPAPPAPDAPDDGDDPLADGAPDVVPAVPDGARDPLLEGTPLPPAPAGAPVDEHPVVVERTATPLAATKAIAIDTR
jgi:hypothetical protein